MNPAERLTLVARLAELNKTINALGTGMDTAIERMKLFTERVEVLKRLGAVPAPASAPAGGLMSLDTFTIARRKESQWFDQAVEKLNKAIFAGSIRQVDLNDVKSGINRALESAYQELVRKEYLWAGKYQTLPAGVEEAIDHQVTLHLLAGQQKKIAKGPDHPARTAALAVVDEFMPLAEAVERMKGKIAVRVVKTAEEKAAEKLIPKTERSAKLLEAIKATFDAHIRPALIEDFEEQMRKYHARLVEVFGPAMAGAKKTYSETTIYALGRDAALPVQERNDKLAAMHRQNGLAGLVSQVEPYLTDVSMARKRDDYYAPLPFDEKNTTPKVIDDAKLRAGAERYAEGVFRQMVGKVLDKAGDMDDGKVERVERNGYSFTVSGAVRGKRITINQTIVHKWTQHGTPFVQFPARIYVDGKFTPEADYKTWLLSSEESAS